MTAADLELPAGATGVVAVVRGSGSRLVAEALNRRGLGTVPVDLGAGEDPADRLAGVVDWLGEYGPTADLEVGLFGAGAGAAAVLLAAAARPDPVRAVVCHGGRPDLAGPALIEVAAPTLFLVGERDGEGLELDRQACATMTVAVELRIVPGGGDQVAEQAGEWFAGHLERRPAH
ncbi:hydrolase [Actinoplanes sp. NPDC049681]|uniref:hydrolase n=1 Tax=Actinoplanes sp. NPDC049681 TaxID=3363905 RepID=UPI0037BD2B81